MNKTGSVFDVVVLGGGNAALCAAISAREAGASVLLIEHAPESRRGGNSRLTRNVRVAHDGPISPLPDRYDEDEYWKDLLSVTEGRTNEGLARIVIEGSKDLIQWMSSHGVEFQPALEGTLSLSRTNAFFLGGGQALVDAYYATAERAGVNVVYDTEVLSLCLRDQTVKEIAVRNSQGVSSVHPKAVVAASGGFQANTEWLRKYWGNAADNFLIRGTPFNTGTVTRSLLDQGVGAAGDPTQFHAVAIDARAPRYDGGLASRLDCIPFSIVVDRDAKRFFDEGQDLWPKRYAIWGRLVAQREEQIAYSIFDSKASDLFMPSMFPPVQASSIPELASALGLDPETLSETVAEFNRSVVPGMFDNQVLDGCSTEGLSPPKSHWARAIDTPPYFGYTLRPGITFTYLGVRVDERARVLMDDGTPTTNLFASGEIMSGNILGQGYLAGFGMTLGAVFGRIAGTEAANVRH
jgi:tricarballylate dehydrogenase